MFPSFINSLLPPRAVYVDLTVRIVPDTVSDWIGGFIVSLTITYNKKAVADNRNYFGILQLLLNMDIDIKSNIF